MRRDSTIDDASEPLSASVPGVPTRAVARGRDGPRRRDISQGTPLAGVASRLDPRPRLASLSSTATRTAHGDKTLLHSYRHVISDISTMGADTDAKIILYTNHNCPCPSPRTISILAGGTQTQANPSQGPTARTSPWRC